MVHLVTDHFPDDAQKVSDPEWMSYGMGRGWSLLTQDGRIRTQKVILDQLAATGTTVHCLHSAELAVEQRAAQFDNHRRRIFHNAQGRRGGFWMVYPTHIVRRWP